MLGRNIRFVMALCEVVPDKGLKKHSHSIWTHTTDDHVVTRMLFVYDGAPDAALSVDTTKVGVADQIRKIIGM
jgi:hypothetical protein